MSRIGKKPVPVPEGVKVRVADRTITVEGPQGTLDFQFRPEVTVAYDGQDNVVNFNDDFELDLQGVVGDQTLDFELCIDPPNQDVARHELRAWGE